MPSQPRAANPLPRPLPHLTRAQAPLTREVEVRDKFGQRRTVQIPAERPLTLFVDKREVVTLMTLGAAPEMQTISAKVWQHLLLHLPRTLRPSALRF